jgi:endonuclease/exonuclease/phosphatase family metal-dependent hydrolase
LYSAMTELWGYHGLLSAGSGSKSLNNPTYNGFNDDLKGSVIDYIFFSSDYFNAKSYKVDRVKNGMIFISDHWPITADLKLK